MTNQEQTNILTKVLSQMADNFTSNQFYRKARQYGYKSSNSTSLFLYKHANSISIKQWRKRDAQNNFKLHKKEPVQAKIELDVSELKNIELKIPEAISLLKSNGYKILKEKIEYEEI